MTSQQADGRSLEELSEWMKSDWDRRAGENAQWYINTVRLDQSEEEFDATGLSEIRSLILPELSLMTGGRDPRGLRLLEIGSGIGRMTKHLAAIFGEVHATDVSGEMIARARERLQGLTNVRLYESNGVDFSQFPDEYFDLVFSAYVFQHVPGKEVIESNLRDAWRTLKPGGILRFHVNGVEAEAYSAREKDTWTGATYTEPEIRSLARQLQARLISVYGGKTMFCWAMMRKPETADHNRIETGQPRIVYFARADQPAVRKVPVAGDDAWLSLVVSGLDEDSIDANSLLVEIGGRDVVPRYVGPVRPHFETTVKQLPGISLDRLVYIEAGIPADVRSPYAWVRVRLESGQASPAIEVELEEPRPVNPRIVTVRNAADYGTDIARSGAKSCVQLFVEYIDSSASSDNVRISLGERLIAPDFVGFVADIAGYRVDFQIPPDIERGPTRLALHFKDAVSEPVVIEIHEGLNAKTPRRPRLRRQGAKETKIETPRRQESQD
ncbi:MAG: class I SAM-dependent methyltransferase [Acidobacteriota bacterium]|nr:MAG: class I SAM-dependent methyltransferase [Acidobacteriota bacterium]